MLTFFYPKIKAEKFWENVTNNGERGLRVRHLIDLISVPAMICYCQCSFASRVAYSVDILWYTAGQATPFGSTFFHQNLGNFWWIAAIPPFSIAMLKKSWILFAFHSVAYKNGGSWAASCQSASLYFCLKSDQVALGFSSNVWKGGSGSNIFLW